MSSFGSGRVSTAKFIRECNMMLARAKMSPRLRDAVEAIKSALINENLYLATELTAVKSYIGGKMEKTAPEVNGELQFFREDSDYNEGVLGGWSVYSILNSMHHELAFALGQFPSGMTIVKTAKIGQGKFDYGLTFEGRHAIPANASSILADMQREHDEIVRAVSMRWRR